MEIGNWRIDDGRKNVAETFRFPLNRRWKSEIEAVEKGSKNFQALLYLV